MKKEERREKKVFRRRITITTALAIDITEDGYELTIQALNPEPLA
ncbi:hypothetical protein [Gracilibacillus caseinilyticus]|nr:hypothetical protein [Gracilibacillus caseinilyticus]